MCFPTGTHVVFWHFSHKFPGSLQSLLLSGSPPEKRTTVYAFSNDKCFSVCLYSLLTSNWPANPYFGISSYVRKNLEWARALKFPFEDCGKLLNNTPLNSGEWTVFVSVAGRQLIWFAHPVVLGNLMQQQRKNKNSGLFRHTVD